MLVEQDIKTAFADLLDIKSYHKISVNDIVERCGIHRNTFYYHFENIPDLVKKMVLDELDRRAKEDDPPSSRLLTYVAPLISYGMDKKAHILNIYRSTDRAVATDFIRKMCDYCVGRYFENITTDPPLTDADIRIMCHYGRGLLTGILIDYLDSGMEFDLLGMIERVNYLLFDLEGSSGYRVLSGKPDTPPLKLVTPDDSVAAHV